MTTQVQPASPQQVTYPESDGQPMADNTKQFRWIVTIQGGLDSLFQNEPNVFVAENLLWCPVEGDNKTRIAPDAMVVFGRPKGDACGNAKCVRGSYKQWQEDNIPPQVVFEVSPGNRFTEMLKKLRFYERYGVEEYYTYDPDHEDIAGWLRSGEDTCVGGCADLSKVSGEELREIETMTGWVSLRLGVRFELAVGLEIYRPDGQFATYVELDQQREQASALAHQEAQRADRLAAKLQELGIDLDAL